MTNLQPEIDNLLHQLAQPSIAPFAIADLTNRLQKLLTARWFEQHPIDERTPADVAAYEAMQEPATCVCGCALDADGKCPLELDAAALSLVEPAVSDGDTEELTPDILMWGNLHTSSYTFGMGGDKIEYVQENQMVDQPSFPHDEAFAGSIFKEYNGTRYPKVDAAAVYWKTFDVTMGIAMAAINYIWKQQS